MHKFCMQLDKGFSRLVKIFAQLGDISLNTSLPRLPCWPRPPIDPARARGVLGTLQIDPHMPKRKPVTHVVELARS